jgi:hypothetical protein
MQVSPASSCTLHGASNHPPDLIPIASPCVPLGEQHLPTNDFVVDTSRSPSALTPGSNDVEATSSGPQATMASGLVSIPVCSDTAAPTTASTSRSVPTSVPNPGAPACPNIVAPALTSTSGSMPASMHVLGAPGPGVSVLGLTPGSFTVVAPISVAPAPP